MRGVLLLLLLAGLSFSTVVGGAQVFKKDFFDPSILKIDESKYLGSFVADVEVFLEDGTRTRVYDLIGDKPAILLLSYYTCEGSCPLRIDSLNRLIKSSSLKDRDFRVLVLSFDREDTLDDLRKFVSAHGPFTDHWVFGLLRGEDIDTLTRSVGFKFFYSERDKTFVHPNAYIFISPEGRITRYLFGVNPEEKDVRIALTEASSGKVSLNSLVDLALLVCYTYDPSRSTFVISPTVIFGGIGFALFGGVALFALISGRLVKREV
ncbi:MAG: SCO family protein [Aquificota bacterium]|nr:SCO family protein [Aquificota bacterium]